MKDTIIYQQNPLQLENLGDSLVQIINRIELIYPDPSENLIFGMPPELASILIPTIISLLVFSLGLFIQWRGKKNDRLQVLKSYKTIIVEWTKLTEDTISTQNLLYQKFAQDLKQQENISPISFIREPFLIDRLNELNLKEFVDLIVINHKGDKTTNTLTLLGIVSHIQKLTNLENTVTEKYLEFSKYTISLAESWNANLTQLNNYITALASRTASSKNKDEIEFYQQFSQVYNEFNSQANSTITSKTRVEKQISELEKVCIESIKKEPTLTEPNNITPILIELQLIEYK